MFMFLANNKKISLISYGFDLAAKIAKNLLRTNTITVQSNILWDVTELKPVYNKDDSTHKSEALKSDGRTNKCQNLMIRTLICKSKQYFT